MPMLADFAPPSAPKLTLPRLNPIPSPFRLWHVDLVAGDPAVWGDRWKHDWRGYAVDSLDATIRARADFYGLWATREHRRTVPLRVVRCFEVGV